MSCPKKVDLTLANLSILKTGKARAIRFSTLEAICKVLDCQPADILEYTKSKLYKFYQLQGMQKAC
jgi:putative transcriptional regulator